MINSDILWLIVVFASIIIIVIIAIVYKSKQARKQLNSGLQTIDVSKPSHVISDAIDGSHKTSQTSPHVIDGPKTSNVVSHVIDGPKTSHAIHGSKTSHAIDGSKTSHAIDGSKTSYAIDGSEPSYAIDGPKTSYVSEVNKLLSYWKEQCETNHNEWLSSVASIYTASYFPQDILEYMKQHFSLLVKQHTMIVSSKDDVNEIKKSCVYRVPVYYGRNIDDAFDENKVKEVLGYDISMVASVDPKVRYIVLGPVKLIDPTMNDVSFQVAHLWGVNLESAVTDDFKEYIDGSGRVKDGYFIAVRNLIYLLCDGVYRARVNFSKKTKIRTPAFGLGAFLNMAKNTDDITRIYNHFIETFIDMCNKFVDLYIDIITFQFPKFMNQVKPESIPENLKILNGDLFDKENIIEDASTYNLVMVNAWDPVSFMGNGLNNDPTIDGMMVAGFGPGEDVKNTSYQQNAFLSPSTVINHEQWIKVDLF
jgi:hypothetical protein